MRLVIRILGTEVFAVDTEKPDKPVVPTDRDHQGGVFGFTARHQPGRTEGITSMGAMIHTLCEVIAGG